MLHQNLRVGTGELDIVASDGSGRFIVEVKTVTPAAGRAGADAVDDAKLAQLRRLGRLIDPPVHRIDIVEVLLANDGAEVRWIRWT